MDDTVEMPADPSQYTLLLGEDDSVAALFDCNRGCGTYEVDEGPTITLEIITSPTRKAFPPWQAWLLR